MLKCTVCRAAGMYSCKMLADVKEILLMKGKKTKMKGIDVQTFD